jgi:type IV secretion system protein VirB10
LEQLDLGNRRYDRLTDFSLVLPCGESASLREVQTDGWQVTASERFDEPVLRLRNAWGLRFTPSFQLIPDGDGSPRGDRVFRFSLVSNCGPERGQWAATGQQNDDFGDVTVPCNCSASATLERDRPSSDDLADPDLIRPVVGNNSAAATSRLGEPVVVNQREISIAANSVLRLKMQSRLSSATAQSGDKFTASLAEDFQVDGLRALPAGTKVEGTVGNVTPARKRSKSGTLAINFTRLFLPSGRAVPIAGELTSLNEKERQQIDEEGRVDGGSSKKRNVVFIGGGAAGGAIIGAIAGGGKGAGIGAAIGAGAGILGALLTKGEEAVIEPGTEFGLLLTQPLRIPNARLDNRDRDRSDDLDAPRPRNKRPSADDLDDDFIYTDAETIYRAQVRLRELGYLRAAAKNRINPPVRRAILNYQADNRLRETGVLDYPTAVSLGVVRRNGRR